MLPNVILVPNSSKIRVYTGQLIDPLNPDFSNISKEDLIESIAHALSNLCRFGGHCREFYSVAQHSVMASRICPGGPAEKLQVLFHDKTEGLGLVDIPRPVKHAAGMEPYRAAEHVLDLALNEKLELTGSDTHIKWCDDQLLVSEMRELAPLSYPFYKKQLVEKGYTELYVPIVPVFPKGAKQMFLDAYETLTNQMRHTSDELSEDSGYPGVF